MKRALDIAVISDVHLGTYGCHAKELSNYLKSIKPQMLILNGDFIDLGELKKNNFPLDHMKVIQRILKMSLNGTKVYYIAGNHDDILRRFGDFNSGELYFRNQLELLLNGKKYWIFHGDIFDSTMLYSRFISRLGSNGYNWLVRFNRTMNHLRMRLGMPRKSFAANIKHSVKEAVRYIADFEETAINLAAKSGYDYVICGHIHSPKLKKVKTDHKEVTYLNAGDWVENLSALEYQAGVWSIYEYQLEMENVISPRLMVKGLEEEMEDEDIKSFPSFIPVSMKDFLSKNEENGLIFE